MSAEIDHYRVIKFIYAIIYGKLSGNLTEQEWIADINVLKYLDSAV